MTVVAVVQARLGSTRLPGKVLRDLGGKPLVERVIDRVNLIEGVDQVVLATSDAPADQELVRWAADRAVACSQGQEADVLDRFWQVVRETSADHIVRITADCPLLCWDEAGRVIAHHVNGGHAYTHNITVLGSGMPLGTGVEVFTAAALESSWREGHEAHHREHVDEFVIEHPQRFPTAMVEAPSHLRRPDLRLTIDTAEDLAVIRDLLRRTLPTDPVPLADVVALIDSEPGLVAGNRHVAQKRY